MWIIEEIYIGIELATINPIDHGELTNEAGISLKPEQILMGYALMEINSENERVLKTKIIQTARMLKNLPWENDWISKHL